MKKDIYLYTILFIINILFFTNCRQPTKFQTNEELVWFQDSDSYGRYIRIRKEPQRIVSLSPGLTEMIFLLDLDEKLVGVSDFCIYPPETKKLTKVGGLNNFNIEHLLSLNPDLLVIGSIVKKEDIEKIEQLGITVFAIREEEHGIQGMFNEIKILGKIFHIENKSDSLVDVLNAELENFHDEVSEQRPSLYYAVGFGNTGDFTVPATSHIHEIIELGGCRNVGEKLKTWSISREFLFQQNPDVILIRAEDKERFIHSLPYSELKAVKENRVYSIESGWIDIVSPRNILAIKRLRDISEKEIKSK
jgi:iron complex transport system substrate-binding protein